MTRVLGLTQPEDVVREFGQHHRDIMLDLILTWASLDGALGMLLSRIAGVPFDIGASRYGRMPASARFAEMRRLLNEVDDSKQISALIKRHKKTYAKFSSVRNLVAHAHCVGIWAKSPDHIVFAVFEDVGEEILVWKQFRSS